MAIRLLPLEIVREIAAGEVIGRPIDVVKELIENAIDAKANRIEVELVGGGLTLIRVSDNGVGIDEKELALAPKRHTTSKFERLDSIKTLGFRGEALWSIAFVSDLVISSRPNGQLGGARIIAKEESRLERLACPIGTVVEVRRLFANLPARKASLDSPAIEIRRVMSLITRYVLHHPKISWRVIIDGELRFNHPSSGWREAAAAAFGSSISNRLLPIDHQIEYCRLDGAISRPELAKPRRNRLDIAVNGRPIETDNFFIEAIQKAYGELLVRGQMPIAVLNFSLPPEKINVNTHPNKYRIAFLEPDVVEQLIVQAIEKSLTAQPLAKPSPLPKKVVKQERKNNFPDLVYIGNYLDSYLLAQGDSDLWIIDQHAAHERVIFEELETAFDRFEPVELTEPELVNLTPAEVSTWRSRHDTLSAWGLELEEFGGGLWRVRSLPAVALGLPLENVVHEVVSCALGPTEARRTVLARLACHPAVRFGHHLESEDAKSLLDALANCHQPWSCPHGRPTTLRLTSRELAYSFGRSR